MENQPAVHDITQPTVDVSYVSAPYPDPAAVSGEYYPANLYASGPSYDYGYDGHGDAYGGHLFVWITLTMLWVVMILAIMALFKYVTHEERRPMAKSRAAK